MADQSSTLKVGDRAPDFKLQAVNAVSSVSLMQLLKAGPAIVEFHRGTW